MATKINKNIALVILAYIVVYVVWGSTYFFIEKALNSFTPFVLGSLRFILASIILMGYCKIKGYKLFNKKIVLQSAFIGFLLLFVDMAAIIWAEQHISSGVAAIIVAAAAIWFVILDKPRWKYNFKSLPVITGVLFGFLGVVMLFAEQIMKTTGGNDKSTNTIALIVLIIGSIAWTVGSLCSKYMRKNSSRKEPDLNVMVKTAWQMITAGILFTLVALLDGEYAQFKIAEVAPVDWFNLLYLVTFGSILAFSSYIWLLQVRPAMEVSTYAYVNPIIALILSHFFTSHHVTMLQVYGLIIILSSVLLMNWNLYKNSKPVRTIAEFCKKGLRFATDQIEHITKSGISEKVDKY